MSLLPPRTDHPDKDSDAPLTVISKCSDCGGSGNYEGFIFLEPCRTCGGTGKAGIKQAAGWTEVSDSLASFYARITQGQTIRSLQPVQATDDKLKQCLSFRYWPDPGFLYLWLYDFAVLGLHPQDCEDRFGVDLRVLADFLRARGVREVRS